MPSKEQQLITLLEMTARSLTDMTGAMTSLSFELLRSEDQVTCTAARQMIDRMLTISAGLDEQWRLLAELSGLSARSEPLDGVVHVAAQAPPALPSN